MGLTRDEDEDEDGNFKWEVTTETHSEWGRFTRQKFNAEKQDFIQFLLDHGAEEEEGSISG